MKRPTFEELVAAVERVCGFHHGRLIGAGRHAQLVTARGLLFSLAHRYAAMSWPEIAAAAGKRSHSGVLETAQRFRRRPRGQAYELELAAVQELFGLDELAATRVIERHEGGERRHPPLIPLTWKGGADGR